MSVTVIKREFDKKSLRYALEEKNVPEMFVPACFMRVNRSAKEAGLVCVNGVSESLFKIGLCLPSGPMLTDEDLAYIVETIKKANK